MNLPLYLRSFLAAVTAAVMLMSVQFAEAGPLPDFTGMVEKYGPAVVNISTTQKKSHHKLLPKGFKIPELPENTPFHEFFRRFFDEGDEMEKFDSESLGSGFIISKDGYVITNNHVIQEAEEIMVRLGDRREFVAEIVGVDERSDLAVLKITATKLPSVRLGRSHDLKVGEWVLAIGSPFGFDHSVTAGIVSAKGRSLPSENYVPFIQTDVAINPGNSGGPLFNLDGEVVGVNSQIYSRTGGFMGLSFAIPIDVAMEVVEQLKDKGRVSRGWLGVLIQDVTRELAESFGMERPHGALVAKVVPDSPAAEAGFQVEDIVLSFNGVEVNHSSDLPPIVGRTRVDRRVSVDILRGGRSQKLTVTIGELPDEGDIELASGGRPGSSDARRLGISVKDLSPKQREEFDLEEFGVLVDRIEGGPAHRSGIHKGDIVVMINHVKVRNSAHFKELAEGLPKGKSVPVLVQRRGAPLFMALKAE